MQPRLDPSNDLQRALAGHRAGRLADAETGYRQVLRRQPGHPVALHGLGLVNHQTGRQEEAVSLLRQAVSASPGSAEFRSNLAAVLGSLGRHAEAAAELRQAVRIKPDYADAWCNLGVALEKSGRPGEAVAAYRRAIQLKPALASAHVFLGNALRRVGRWAEAEAAQREAVRLAPENASAHAALASTLGGLGNLEEVIRCRRKVVELRPKSASAGSALLCTLHYDPAYSPQDLLAEARAWAARHAGREDEDVVTAAPHANTPDPSRRLRVGFVSGSLTAHPEGRFLRPVLACLDRERFETFVYSGTGRGDPITATLRSLCDGWRDIGGLPDARAERLVRDDRIDILVDLSGHFGGSRMLLLARKPAPVQVAQFGYPGTSGLDAIDWRVTDRHADPLADPEADGQDGPGSLGATGGVPYATEKPWRVADLAWCYEPPMEARAVGALPAKARGYVTFACVNNTIKVTPQAVEVWAKILRELPASRLEVLAEGGEAKRRGERKPAKPRPSDAAPAKDAPAEAGEASGPGEAAAPAERADDRGRHLLEEFERHGVEPGRVRLVPRQPRDRYFEWIHSADIALDPFPYNGGVTSCDTLWMGVPLVALQGNSYWSRQGLALLRNLGLDELVAATPDDYVRLAVDLSRDLDRLAAIRASLRGRMRRSPIADAEGFVQKLEAAYADMWASWCATRGRS